mgnify:CR=1 FL=1
MLESINENKLLFLDIETAGSHKNSNQLKEMDETLWDLWNTVGCSYFRRNYPEDEDKDCDFLYEDPEVMVWSNDKEASINHMLGTDKDFILTEYSPKK